MAVENHTPAEKKSDRELEEKKKFAKLLALQEGKKTYSQRLTLWEYFWTENRFVMGEEKALLARKTKLSKQQIARSFKLMRGKYPAELTLEQLEKEIETAMIGSAHLLAKEKPSQELEHLERIVNLLAHQQAGNKTFDQLLILCKYFIMNSRNVIGEEKAFLAEETKLSKEQIARWFKQMRGKYPAELTLTKLEEKIKKDSAMIGSAHLFDEKKSVQELNHLEQVAKLLAHRKAGNKTFDQRLTLCIYFCTKGRNVSGKEKAALAEETSLSKEQVARWFKGMRKEPDAWDLQTLEEEMRRSQKRQPRQPKITRSRSSSSSGAPKNIDNEVDSLFSDVSDDQFSDGEDEKNEDEQYARSPRHRSPIDDDAMNFDGRFDEQDNVMENGHESDHKELNDVENSGRTISNNQEEEEHNNYGNKRRFRSQNTIDFDGTDHDQLVQLESVQEMIRRNPSNAFFYWNIDETYEFFKFYFDSKIAEKAKKLKIVGSHLNLIFEKKPGMVFLNDYRVRIREMLDWEIYDVSRSLREEELTISSRIGSNQMKNSQDKKNAGVQEEHGLDNRDVQRGSIQINEEKDPEEVFDDEPNVQHDDYENFQEQVAQVERTRASHKSIPNLAPSSSNVRTSRTNTDYEGYDNLPHPSLSPNHNRNVQRQFMDAQVEVPHKNIAQERNARSGDNQMKVPKEELVEDPDQEAVALKSNPQLVEPKKEVVEPHVEDHQITTVRSKKRGNSTVPFTEPSTSNGEPQKKKRGKP